MARRMGRRRRLRQHGDAQAGGHQVAHGVEAAHLHAQAQRPAGGMRGLCCFCSSAAPSARLIQSSSSASAKAIAPRPSRRWRGGSTSTSSSRRNTRQSRPCVSAPSTKTPSVGAAFAQGRHDARPTPALPGPRAPAAPARVRASSGGRNWLMAAVLAHRRRCVATPWRRSASSAPICSTRLQQRHAVAGEDAAGRRGQHAAAMPLEQRLADGGLELADAAAGGGEGQVRFARRRADAAVLHAVGHEPDRHQVEARQVVAGRCGGRHGASVPCRVSPRPCAAIPLRAWICMKAMTFSSTPCALGPLDLLAKAQALGQRRRDGPGRAGGGRGRRCVPRSVLRGGSSSQKFIPALRARADAVVAARHQHGADSSVKSGCASRRAARAEPAAPTAGWVARPAAVLAVRMPAAASAAPCRRKRASCSLRHLVPQRPGGLAVAVLHLRRRESCRRPARDGRGRRAAGRSFFVEGNGHARRDCSAAARPSAAFAVSDGMNPAGERRGGGTADYTAPHARRPPARSAAFAVRAAALPAALPRPHRAGRAVPGAGGGGHAGVPAWRCAA